MKRTRIILGLLLAAFALTAVGAAGASAATPEYKLCKKSTKLIYKYANAACTEVSGTKTGAYETVAAKFPIKIKGVIGAAKFFLYNPETSTIEARVACAKGKNEGVLSNSTTGALKLTYEGCEAVGGKFPGPCTTPGQLKAGTIVTLPLATKLVWLDEAQTKVGILTTGGGEAQEITAVKCGGGLVEVVQSGSELAEVSPANSAGATHGFVYGANETTGARDYSAYFEGGVSVPALFNTKLDVPSLGVHYPKIPTSEIAGMGEKGPATLFIGA